MSPVRMKQLEKVDRWMTHFVVPQHYLISLLRDHVSPVEMLFSDQR
jgi:hypothetical protein